jgi:hypothetical protein
MVNAAMADVAALLDCSRMETIFSQHVFAGASVSSCRILHFRYKPYKTWIVSYEVSLAGIDGEKIVYMRAVERRGSAARYAKSSALHQDVRHIPELDSVAWLFPSDRKLTGLHTLCDSAKLRDDVLPALATAAYGPGWNVRNCSHEIVHYLPERSCMVRLDASLVRPQGVGISATFYGKAYPDGQGADTYRYLAELWDRPRLRVAQPLLYDPDSLTMWQLGITGVGPDVHSQENLEGAAAALAELHCSHVSGLPAYVSTARRLDEAAGVITAALPDRRDRIAALIQLLRAQSAQLAERPRVTLHGDLHLKNFIVTEQGVALIDLDTLALGDPIEDLASFAAALLSSGAARPSVCVTPAFVEAYERAAGWHVPEFDLNWHIAAALLTERVLRAVTRMKPDSPSPDVLIDLAWHFAHMEVAE